jgi:hypothetical protein
VIHSGGEEILSEIILNPSFNEWITEITNSEYVRARRAPSKKEKEFLKRCYDINVKKRFYFSKHDFSGMKDSNFRQYIHKLSSIIVKGIDSRPAFYYLKGIKIDGITVNHTEVNSITDDFDKILKELHHQPPELHDIRIETLTEGLYQALCKKKKPHDRNKQIVMEMPKINTRFKTKVSISQNGRLLVMLGCTQKPLPYSILGFDELIEYLAKLTNYLMMYSEYDFVHETVANWKIVYYHFNKDGKIVDSHMFKYRIEDLQEHSVVYLKTLDTGEKVLRWEKKVSPNKTIEEEQKKSADLP